MRYSRCGIGLTGVGIALSALAVGSTSVAAPQQQIPRTWTGQATWKHDIEDESKSSSDDKREETHYVATIRVTFGKAPRRYGPLYVVKSGTLTWSVSGSTVERLTGIAETTCTWSISRTVRVSKYAGSLLYTRGGRGNRGVFSAPDTYGSPVRTTETCTRKWLTSHTPPVDTQTLSLDETAPNPLFLLSRKTAGLPAKGSPPVISGSGRTSTTTQPPSGSGIQVGHSDRSTWSWRFTARG